MFRSFLRLVTSTSDQSTAQVAGKAGALPKRPAPVVVAESHGTHRERLFSMRLQHIKLCGARRCEKFAKAKIISVGDLASCDPIKVAQKIGAPQKAVATIKRYRRCIHLAASVAGLMPRDADLLIQVHRGSVRSIAQESPAVLHRDLLRYAESTVGRRFVGSRRLPSLRKVKSWVATCQNQVAKNAVAAGETTQSSPENPQIQVA